MIALCLTMVMTVVIAADKNTKAEASPFDYFKRVKLKDCIISLEYEKVDIHNCVCAAGILCE